MDPHCPHQLGADEGHGLSIVAGNNATPQPHWDNRSSVLQGTILSAQLSSPADSNDFDLDVVAYLPTHLPESQHSCGLLTLFDAEAWFTRLELPTALESAMSDGMLPFAVLGISNNSNKDRLRQLGGNAEFLDSVNDVGASWIHKHAEGAGISLDPNLNVISGQSLGGLSALYAGVLHPDRYTTIIAQSPSLWWSPEPGCTPRDLMLPTHGWLTERMLQSTRLPSQVIIDVGTREIAMVTKAHILDMALSSRGVLHELQVHDGGHDYAWWRGALIDHLSQLQPARNKSR